MTLSAYRRDEQRPLGLICIFPLTFFDARWPQDLREPAFEPRSLDLGSGGLSPRAPWGSVGVGRVSCIHPILGFHNQRGRANDTCLNGSSVALNELANGYVHVESGSIIR